MMLLTACQTTPRTATTEGMRCPRLTTRAEAALALAAVHERDLAYWVQEMARFCDALEGE